MFNEYKEKLDKMSYEELYSFYKNFNSYIKTRTIMHTSFKWDNEIKDILDGLSQIQLSVFSRLFNQYVRNRVMITPKIYQK